MGLFGVAGALVSEDSDRSMLDQKMRDFTFTAA